MESLGPVSILMPVCDEEELIERVVDEWITDVLSRLAPGSELVFDDASKDRTTEILHRIAERHPFVKVHASERDGFMNAARRLYRRASCPLVFFTDSDGQYVAEDFWRVAEALEGNDMAHGYKLHRSDPRYRIVASGVMNGLVRVGFRSRGHDVNSAFRLIKKEALDWVLPQLGVVPTLLNAEMYLRLERAGFRIADVPIRHRPRASTGPSRGLPPETFVRDSFRVFQGLRALEKELRR